MFFKRELHLHVIVLVSQWDARNARPTLGNYPMIPVIKNPSQFYIILHSGWNEIGNERKNTFGDEIILLPHTKIMDAWQLLNTCANRILHYLLIRVNFDSRGTG